MKQIQGSSVIVVAGLVALVLIAGGYAYVRNANEVKKTEEAKMMDEKMKIEEKAMMEKETMVGKEGDSMETEVDAMMKKDEGAMKGEDTMMKKDSEMKNDDAMMKKEDSAMMPKQGTYTNFSADALVTAQKGKTVLFFHAGWCPTCRTADADITANVTTIPAGVTILKTDYDKEVALKQKYGVTSQHTFVEIDKSGAMIQKWSGGNLAGIVAKL